jgi:hypothetical protein
MPLGHIKEARKMKGRWVIAVHPGVDKSKGNLLATGAAIGNVEGVGISNEVWWIRVRDDDQRAINNCKKRSCWLRLPDCIKGWCWRRTPARLRRMIPTRGIVALWNASSSGYIGLLLGCCCCRPHCRRDYLAVKVLEHAESGGVPVLWKKAALRTWSKRKYVYLPRQYTSPRMDIRHWTLWPVPVSSESLLPVQINFLQYEWVKKGLWNEDIIVSDRIDTYSKVRDCWRKQQR